MVVVEKVTNEQFDLAVKDRLKWLRLDPWKIEILPDKPDEEAILCINVVEGRYLGAIRISDYFHEMEAREQSESICHELLHLKQQRLNSQLQHLTKNTSTDTKIAVKDMFILEIEYMTDWLAGVLADVFPIPESLLAKEKEEEMKPEITD